MRRQGRRFWRWSQARLLHFPSYTGIILALWFYAISLTPSLLPRTWLFQGVASGFSLVTGYGVGVFIMAVWRYLQIRQLEGQYLQWARIASAAFVGVQLMIVIMRTGGWQNRVRELVGMEPAESSHLIRAAIVAFIIALLVLVMARVINYATKRTIKIINKYLPRRVSITAGVVIALWFFGTVASGAFMSNALNFANSIYSGIDKNIKDGTVRPTSPLRSGSPDSLVAWDDIGRQGKAFVGQGPTADDIAAFTSNAKEPIRVYAGLRSGETHEERAELALQELIRTNAFERDSILIATATGTGYLDPNSVDTYEYVNGGDTAIVSIQYSFLPSWIALISDTETAKDASIALFNEVHNYWQDLDEETRPEIYLYGLSLGAYGSQSSISRVEALNDPVDGALWVGSPFVSEFWNRITDNRDEGSPAWRPIYQGGKVIRFTGPENSLYNLPEEWEDNKIIYVQNATDPVVFFSTDYLWQNPEWLQGERGPGVTEDMNYFPLVTFWQLAADFFGAGATPEDFGHLYSKSTYIDAWVALTEPDGWSEQDAVELKQLLQN